MSVDLAKLKYAVGHGKYSFHQIVRKAGWNYSYYRYWKGERKMPLEVALKIAYYSGIPANEFLSEDVKYLLRSTIAEQVSEKEK